MQALRIRGFAGAQSRCFTTVCWILQGSAVAGEAFAASSLMLLLEAPPLQANPRQQHTAGSLTVGGPVQTAATSISTALGLPVANWQPAILGTISVAPASTFADATPVASPPVSMPTPSMTPATAPASGTGGGSGGSGSTPTPKLSGKYITAKFSMTRCALLCP